MELRLATWMVVGLLLGQPALAQNLSGRVQSVADGDTLDIVDAARQRHRIRLVDIDAPERDQRLGASSRDSLSELCWRKNAVVEGRGVDQYGRTLGYVFCDGVNTNLEQVRRGLAWASRPPAGSPIQGLENEARAARRGVWQDNNPTPPWQWRRAHPPPG